MYNKGKRVEGKKKKKKEKQLILSFLSFFFCLSFFLCVCGCVMRRTWSMCVCVESMLLLCLLCDDMCVFLLERTTQEEKKGRKNKQTEN